MKQTYQDFEILVVDDYSDIPLTLNIDSRIQVFRNHKNIGPGLSRNVGLENAKGEFIAFLDSDDYWDKDFLFKTLKTIKKHKDVAFVYAKSIAFDDDEEYSKRNCDSYQDTILPNILINKRGWNSSSCLWNAEVIRSIRYGKTRNWEDYAFDIEAAIINNKIKFIDEYLVYCEVGGTDKLSKTNYLERSLEKTSSLLKINALLRNTDYIKNDRLRTEITKEFITSLEIMRWSNYDDQELENKVLNSLRIIQNPIAFNLVRLVCKSFDDNLASKILNKIKNHFY